MMRLLVAGVLLLLAVGCSPKRTELGYGFYQLEKPAGNIIRRERDESGEIVDVTWLPDMHEVDPLRGSMSVVVEHRVLVTRLPLRMVRDEKLSPTREDYFEFLVKNAEHKVLDLQQAQLQKFASYSDLVARFGVDSLICEYAYGFLEMYSFFGWPPQSVSEPVETVEPSMTN